MFGNVTALEELRVTGKYRDRSMQLICSRDAAWDPLVELPDTWFALGDDVILTVLG